MRLGSSDPLVCNRHLIWGITGVVWMIYWWISLYQTADFETDVVWSSAIDRANGVVEITGIALVWLIFFPPHFYRRWLAGSVLAAEPERT